MKPHRIKYWETSPDKDDPAFTSQAIFVCSLYRLAGTLFDEGQHVISCDEKTGMQALERANATLPMKPGLVEKQEFEYIRHGTLSLIASYEVATGEVCCASIGPTRTEKDFVAHVKDTVATDEEGSWIFIVDQLNTHMSASLVEFVAAYCGLDVDLGEKGKRGILQSKASRKAFLEQPRRIQFVYTPRHSSWLNQVELWFSILARRLLKRASFISTEELKQRVLKFIDFFNHNMAKPFRWNYTGVPKT